MTPAVETSVRGYGVCVIGSIRILCSAVAAVCGSLTGARL
jgi:hypothetical protein